MFVIGLRYKGVYYIGVPLQWYFVVSFANQLSVVVILEWSYYEVHLQSEDPTTWPLIISAGWSSDQKSGGCVRVAIGGL